MVVAKGVVVNGPRTIAPSSIFFPFSKTAPPTFRASAVVRKPGVAALEVGGLDDEPRDGVLGDRTAPKPLTTAEQVLDFLLGQGDEFVARAAEERIEDGRFSRRVEVGDLRLMQAGQKGRDRLGAAARCPPRSARPVLPAARTPDSCLSFAELTSHRDRPPRQGETRNRDSSTQRGRNQAVQSRPAPSTNC